MKEKKNFRGKIFYMEDFPNHSTRGKIRKGPCPICGSKDNLVINVVKRYVKCYTPGCDCYGLLKDGRRPDGKQIEQELTEEDQILYNEGVRTQWSFSNIFLPDCRIDHYITDMKEVPIDPSDYKEVNGKVRYSMKPLNDDPNETDANILQVRQYLTDQKIPLDVAMTAGVLCGSYPFKPEVTRHICGEKAEYLPVIGYPNYLEGRMIGLKYRTVSTTPTVTDHREYEKFFATEKPSGSLPTPPYGIARFFPFEIEVLDRGCENTDILPEFMFWNPNSRFEHAEQDPRQTVIVCEGEKDALALATAGFWNVMSVPNGADCDLRTLLKPFMNWISRQKSIIISGDKDLPGRMLKMNMMYMFSSRLRIVEFSPECKDAADELRLNGPESLRNRVLSAVKVPGRDFRSPIDNLRGIVRNLNGGGSLGYTLGYGDEIDRQVLLNEGGALITVTGNPGSGKSDFMYDLAAHLIAKAHKRVALCTLEEPENGNAESCIIQSLYGEEDFVTEEVDHPLSTEEREAEVMREVMPYVEAIDPYCRCFDVEGNDPSVDEIFKTCELMMENFRTDVLIIDNYARTRRDGKTTENESDQVRAMLSAAANFCHRHHIVLFFIAHPRKPQDKAAEEDPDPVSIAGSAHWWNLSDYVWSVVRKHKVPKPGEPLDSLVPSYKYIHIWKSRNQQLQHLGYLYLIRQACHRHEARPSLESIELEFRSNGGFYNFADTGTWIDKHTF